VEKLENKIERLAYQERFKEAKERHPDPRSHKDKLLHFISDYLKWAERWLEERAELMVKESGINEVVEKLERDKIRLLGVGAGKQDIEQEIIKENKDKDFETVGIDLFDTPSRRVLESEEYKQKMNSIFAKGEHAPIKDNSIDISEAFFTFQELNDKQQKEVLGEMKRVLAADGRIVIVDEIPQKETVEKFSARAKNLLRNLRNVEFNLRSNEEWKKLFEELGLEVEDYKQFREDGKKVDKNYEPQFFSYVLKKADLQNR